MLEVPRAGAYGQAPLPPTAPPASPAAVFAPIFAERPAPAPAVAAPAADAPRSGAFWSGVADESAPSPADDAEAAATDGGSPLTPRWGEVPQTSFDAITRPESDQVPGVSPARPESRETQAGPGPRGPSYTWLHFLALALVAFVLGFLVWLLVNRGSTQPGAASAFAPVPAMSTSATSSPHQGEL